MPQVTVSRRYNPATKEFAYGGNIKLSGKISLDEIVERINDRCTVTKPDILAVLAAFQQQAIYALRNAQGVSLGNIGTLYLRLRCKKAATMDEFTSANIISIRTGLRAGKKLIRQIQKGRRDYPFVVSKQ